MIHVINQHIWPDGSPAAILEEQLADSLLKAGEKVVLVAGRGSFRDSKRPKPKTPIIYLEAKESGSRESLTSVFNDYRLIYKAFKKYIAENVQDGDTVIATSSPFINACLIKKLRKKQVLAIHHLHDYFPASLKSISSLHGLLYRPAKIVLDHYLRQWDIVINVHGNLEYNGKNKVVYRFWPTIAKPRGAKISQAKRAAYFGNFGITHDDQALVKEIERLHKSGYEISFFGSGPKTKDLPRFVKQKTFKDEADLIKQMLANPVHLAAGTPRDARGSYPTKTINSLYLGAKVIPAGFLPPQLKELEHHRNTVDLTKNLTQLTDYLLTLIQKTQA